MRRSVLRRLLVLTTTASIGLLITATTAANAATTHPSDHLLMVSKVQLTKARIGELPNSAAAPDSTTRLVAPRLSLAGCSRQDGFNGNIQWEGYGQTNPYIKVWGEIWDVCGTRAYLYLSWDSPLGYNVEAGNCYANGTCGVNYYVGQEYLAANPGYIHVTVCANWKGGWHCGASQYV